MIALWVSTVAQLTGRHYSIITWHMVGWQKRWGWHCWARTSTLGGGGDILHTSTPTWASEPIVSEGCFSWKAGWKYRLKRKKKKETEGEEEIGIQINKTKKQQLYLPVVTVNPQWVLPGDIGGDSGSHVLHDRLNPVTTDSRGHRWQGARSFFTLKTEAEHLTDSLGSHTFQRIML